jgi:rubrerythrin
MTSQEALQLALSKEADAIELYERLSNSHPEIRELLTSLLNEEYKHKTLIEKKLSQLSRY